MTTAEATVLVAALALVGTIISVAGTVYVALNLGKARGEVASARGEVASVGENLARVETKVDGKMDKLLEASVGRAHAEGITTGEQSERDRGSVPVAPVSGPTPVTIENAPNAPVPVDIHTNPKP